MRVTLTWALAQDYPFRFDDLTSVEQQQIERDRQARQTRLDEMKRPGLGPLERLACSMTDKYRFGREGRAIDLDCYRMRARTDSCPGEGWPKDLIDSVFAGASAGSCVPSGMYNLSDY
jgi:hypothetical protein